jgi:DNA-directed RNA polymerase specialized sigma24 family protein
VAARKKLSNTKPPSEAPGINAQQVDRLIRLIALLVVKGESKGEKIQILAGAGFGNAEIAELLGLTANSVNVALYRMRSQK